MITITGLLLLVFLAGLTGPYIFFTILLGFLATYAVLTLTEGEGKGENPAGKEKTPEEKETSFAIEIEKEISRGNDLKAEDPDNEAKEKEPETELGKEKAD